MWALTDRVIYQKLVQGQQWTSDEYEKWLGEILIQSLLQY
jgi:hypothetical protein